MLLICTCCCLCRDAKTFRPRKSTPVGSKVRPTVQKSICSYLINNTNIASSMWQYKVVHAIARFSMSFLPRPGFHVYCKAYGGNTCHFFWSLKMLSCYWTFDLQILFNTTCLQLTSLSLVFQGAMLPLNASQYQHACNHNNIDNVACPGSDSQATHRSHPGQWQHQGGSAAAARRGPERVASRQHCRLLQCHQCVVWHAGRVLHRQHLSSHVSRSKGDAWPCD